MYKSRFPAIALAVIITILVMTAYQKFFDTRAIRFNGQENVTESVKKFNEIKNILNADHYLQLDQNKLIEGAINGMVDSINDDYTIYFTKEEWDKRKERIEGEYEGIGVTVTTVKDKGTVIIDVLENLPASNAGLKKNDIIVEVDGVDVKEESYNEVVDRIKNSEKKEVEIGVYRPSTKELLKKILIKQTISDENVFSKLIDKDIGLIRIKTFSDGVFKDFKSQYEKLVKKKIKGLIIDVRNNPGGNMYDAVKICDMFLKNTNIVYLQNKYGEKMYEKADNKADEIPLVILANQNSASASEILSAAIKENNRGLLIGEKTFGKGLVQTYKELKDGSCIYYTTAIYFTPKGNFIHKKGVEPSINVKNDSEKIDEQLQRAIKELRSN